ncbi:MAG: hotdog domain-containing protein [Acidimicrobiales bacterium]
MTTSIPPTQRTETGRDFSLSPARVSDYFRLERWELPASDDVDKRAQLFGRMPVESHQCSQAGGLTTGGLLSGVDSIGGMTAGLSVLPRWIVTTNMMATIARLSNVGPLRLHSIVLRCGRRSVVVAVEVVDEGDHDATVALVTMTCAVLDAARRDLHFERPIGIEMPPPDPHPVVPEVFFGIEPGSGPETRLVITDHLLNPWGILHGGALALLADVAACRAVVADRKGSEARWASPACGDTVIHYLQPSRVGPIVARCEVLGGEGDRLTVRVEMHDVGLGDRLVGVASVQVIAC